MKQLLFTILLLAASSALRADDVAIVVAKDCPLEELSLADLRAIFRCEKVISPARSKWIVLLRPAASPEQGTVLKSLFKSTADDLAVYFRLGEFNGSIDPAPKTIPSAALERHIISGNKSAIGYMLVSEVTDDVKVLRIGGALPGTTNYPLKPRD